MRKTVLGLLAGAMMTGAVWAQEALMPVPGIEDTIGRQMEAFRADNVGTAFGFAAPSIQNMFRTPENFGAMVQGGYPMLWRPGDVQFGDLREIEGALWQKVIVTDSAGKTWVLDYKMQKIGDDWRIAGVQILPAPEISA